MLQALIVAVLVACCFVYAAWALIPAAARKWLASRLLERKLPAFLAEALRPYATAASGCSCDGCDRSGKVAPRAAASGSKPITFHPRRQR
jgi:uncharacterized membrane protein YccC